MKSLVEAYLNHLGMQAQKPSIEYLCALQKNHIETIPHENLNAAFHLPTSFDIKHLLKKYTMEMRGGMCFELNFSYCWLLQQLGFNAQLVLCNVDAYDLNKENNPYPTHPVVAIYFENTKLITDVGWSDSYRFPLYLDGEIPPLMQQAPFSEGQLSTINYTDETGTYRVIRESDFFRQQKLINVDGDAEWHNQFVFTFPQNVAQNKAISLPRGYLTSHAYTHVAPEYLFSYGNVVKFSRINSTGHHTLWGNFMLNRDGQKRRKEIIKQSVDKQLQELHVAEETINLIRDTKHEKRKSMSFFETRIQYQNKINDSKVRDIITLC